MHMWTLTVQRGSLDERKIFYKVEINSLDYSAWDDPYTQALEVSMCTGPGNEHVVHRPWQRVTMCTGPGSE